MNTHKKYNKLYTFVGVVSALVVFGAGIFVGTIIEVRKSVLDGDGEVQISKVLDLYSKTRSDEVSFNQFWNIWDKIKTKHVSNKEISDVDLFYGAMEGLVKGLDDPYSVYFPPKEAQEFAKDLAGEFEGISAEIGIRDERLTVIAPLPESPAEKSGLKTGDKILAIDGEDTFGITVESAVQKIRGKRGTTVTLTMSSNGLNTARDVDITRDTINVPTVRLETVGDNIAHLRVSYFNGETGKEFDKAVKEIIKQNPKGIILDMRSNPGGFLDTSIDVASEWIKEGVIVSEKFTNGKVQHHDTTGLHRLAGYKTIVLVDGGTASGSEIVAGALQDYEQATLVGQKTYGKGSVQDFEPFSDGSALKLTIAKWFTPKDRGIDGEGIAPDIELEEQFSVNEDLPEGDENRITDLGLEKALELLNTK